MTSENREESIVIGYFREGEGFGFRWLVDVIVDFREVGFGISSCFFLCWC